MNRSLRRLFIIILLLFTVVFVVKRMHVFPSIGSLFKPKPVVVDESPLIVTQVKSLAQLMTVEVYNEVVVDSMRFPLGVPPQLFNAIPGNPLGLFGASQLVLIVRGKVICGVNLQTLDTAAIRLRNDSLFISLPPAQVFDVITNPSDVETFIEKGTWSEAAATALKLKARQQLLNQAIAQGALTQADSKARELVYGFLKNLNYKYVAVSTRPIVRTPSRQ